MDISQPEIFKNDCMTEAHNKISAMGNPIEIE